MSSSKSEEQQIQISISIDEPHGGKRISDYVFSPNMQYIATLSSKDQSIIGWTITKELTIEYGNSISADDLKSVLNTREEMFPRPTLDYVLAEYRKPLVGVSECGQIILNLENYSGFFGKYSEVIAFEIIDITTKSRQILSAQGLIGTAASIAFLKNGCLIIISPSLDYRAHVFLKSKSSANINGHAKISYNSYILNPRTYTLDESPDTDVLHDIYSPTYQDYKSIGSINIISDYIIKINNNNLSIQKLSQNKSWKNYLNSKEHYISDTFFNVKEIKHFVQTKLEKYKTNQIMTQVYSDKPIEYSGKLCKWIVEHYYDEELHCVKLNARLESGDEISGDWFFLNADIFESKVLKNGDILNLTSFNENLNYDSEILPPPTFITDTEIVNNEKHVVSSNGSLNINKLTLKLYGKDLLHELFQNESNVKIMELLDKCYEYSLSNFQNSNFSDFILFISQIALSLVELGKYNKNLRTIETFLSKTNMLVSNNYNNAISETSQPFHLQHSGTYINLHNLFNTSFFNYLFFWIFEKKNFLKRYFSQIYNILAFPYLIYSSYFNIYPRKTIRLTIPLLGFATYPENYSYKELFYLNVSTIPKDEISWNNQVIFLVLTVIFGFIHLIFEVRQFIYKPIPYIVSPWNWFDLAAILVPIITSFIWLHIKAPPIWIITIAAFLLEIKFLLFIHALEYFGKYFAIMIGVFYLIMN
ncbi:wd-40 repeat protein [Gigaspora margarita]|uniref:Wd-40 repeat protein n=1 Tax=Gigaspora margarita TaxID=4874 RepID=A0A8H4ARV6_GIGMA|nr:wd-40 repeat protein [Gigaspora margarita]